MNGWSSRVGDNGWDDEPTWVYELTWEWEPLHGQRYPGDPGPRKATHTPVYDASQGGGRAAAAPSETPSRYAAPPEIRIASSYAPGAPASIAPKAMKDPGRQFHPSLTCIMNQGTDSSIAAPAQRTMRQRRSRRPTPRPVCSVMIMATV